MDEIKVIALRPLNREGPLKAFVDVQIGQWIVCEWRIIKRDGERAWISPPQASWKDRDGKVRYRILLTIPGELKQRIEAAILSAWEREIAGEQKRR